MNKLFIALLIVGFAVMGFFLWKIDSDVKTVEQAVQRGSSLATSTDPLVQLGQGVVTAVGQLNVDLVKQVKALEPVTPQK